MKSRPATLSRVTAKSPAKPKRHLVTVEVPKCLFDLLKSRGAEQERKAATQARVILKAWFRTETGRDAE